MFLTLFVISVYPVFLMGAKMPYQLGVYRQDLVMLVVS